MVDKTNGSPSNTAAGGMTKKGAVEKGLATLGNSATPTQLKKHILDRFHIEMDLKHISTAKAKILKESGEHKMAAAPKAAAKLPAVHKVGFRKETTAKTSMPHSIAAHGISLKDIETVKELVDRVGASSLKKLIDVMAR